VSSPLLPLFCFEKFRSEDGYFKKPERVVFERPVTVHTPSTIQVESQQRHLLTRILSSMVPPKI